MISSALTYGGGGDEERERLLLRVKSDTRRDRGFEDFAFGAVALT
jgi:hypothetical protein